MNIFDIAWLTVKWLTGVSIGVFSVFFAWALVVGIIKGIAEAISD